MPPPAEKPAVVAEPKPVERKQEPEPPAPSPKKKKEAAKTTKTSPTKKAAAAGAGQGKAVQIVSIDAETNQFTLNEDALKGVLLGKACANKPAVVVSVAGKESS